MNVFSLKLPCCAALLLSATGSVCAQTISTQPFSFDLSVADPRRAMELAPGEEVVYDNPRGEKGSILLTKEELGDEIQFKAVKGLLKSISQFQFEYIAALNTFESGQSGVLSIYANDTSAENGDNPKKPGELLFQSDSFALEQGYSMVTVAGLDVMIPPGTRSVTWSVDFSGLTAIGSAGLMTHDVPEVGSSSTHCWVNAGTVEQPSWTLKEETSKPFNFSARISVKDVAPEIHIKNDLVRPDKPFDVKFNFGTSNTKDWIGIYEKNMIPGAQAPLTWVYLNSETTPPDHGIIEGTATVNLAELPPGDYTVYFFENDTYEDLARLPFKVADITPPVIKLLGQRNVRINVGDEYQDAGASAIDDYDGDITKSIEVKGAVDSSKPGVYTITYNVEDVAGNASGELARTVEVERDLADWTVMVYAHADHNLTPALMEDLLEMEQAGSSDHFNIITQTDINTKARATKLWKLKHKVNPDDFDGITRLLIGPDTDGKPNTLNSSIVERYPEENNMDSPDELKNFVDWSVENYPAKRYGLVLWNHGGQFIGYGGDTQNGTLKHGKGLTCGQIREALLSSLNEGNIHKFDFIGFDTCLMGATEVIADFHDLCEIYFACAELDYGDGWDYDNTLNYLKSNPEIDIRSFALNEVQIWDEHHSYSSMDKTHKVHAAFDMEKYDEFAVSFQEFSLLLNDYAKLADNEIAKLRAEATHYSVSSRSNAKSPTHFIDLGDLVDKVATTVMGDDALKSAAQELSAKIKQMVIAKAVGSERLNVSALSIAYPHNTEDWNQKYKKLYEKISFVSTEVGSQWKLFLQYFGLMSQSDISGPTVTVLNNTRSYSNSNRDSGGVEVDYLTVSLNNPAILDFAIIGDDAFELSATLVVPGQDGLAYDYIGEVGVFRIETPGSYELMWPGTNPMITSPSTGKWLDLGAWYTNSESNQMISFADYQPPESEEKIQLFLFSEFDSDGVGFLHTILEDSGQDLPDSDAVAATPASSSLQLEPGGKLWPVYYSEAWNEEVQEWEYSEFFFEEEYITIPEAGIDEIFIQYNEAIAGNYSLEIQVTDYFGNRSQYVDYNITIPDTGEVSEGNDFVSKLEYIGEYEREMPPLKTGRYVDEFDDVDPDFISFIYVKWRNDGVAGDKLQSSSSLTGPWQDVSNEFIDEYDEEYVFWTETEGEMQYFRIIGQQ